MFIIFVDECGYQPNWNEEKAIKDQPVHVVAAVAISSEHLSSAYTRIRNDVAQLGLEGIDPNALGKGQEIRANAVDRGDDFWSKNPMLRNGVRKIYLDHSEVTYFLVFIDKQRHLARYVSPDDPAVLGLQYAMERVQGFLNDKSRPGLIIVDVNKRTEAVHRDLLKNLLVEGSLGKAVSKWYGLTYEWRLKFENITEVYFSDSKYSLGLQIADFVARHAYSWWKSGKSVKRNSYPGWEYIEKRLYKYPNYNGWGYKEFPDPDK